MANDSKESALAALAPEIIFGLDFERQKIDRELLEDGLARVVSFPHILLPSPSLLRAHTLAHAL